jgi:hypothetical protein
MKPLAMQSHPGFVTALTDSYNLILWSLINFYFKLDVIGMICEFEVLKEMIMNWFPGCDVMLSRRKHQQSEGTYFVLFRVKIVTEFGDILNKLQAGLQNFSKNLEATSKV